MSGEAVNLGERLYIKDCTFLRSIWWIYLSFGILRETLLQLFHYHFKRKIANFLTYWVNIINLKFHLLLVFLSFLLCLPQKIRFTKKENPLLSWSIPFYKNELHVNSAKEENELLRFSACFNMSPCRFSSSWLFSSFNQICQWQVWWRFRCP